MTIARAGFTVQFPASFQLALAVNPCPCGNLGKANAVCICSSTEINRYWKKLGGALLDRIDIRIPLKNVSAAEMLGREGEPSAIIRERVTRAVEFQQERYRGYPFSRNSRIPPGYFSKFCPLDTRCSGTLARAVEKLSLSSRGYHSIVKIARTIADLARSETIRKDHIMEALQHRRYGDGDIFWNYN